MRRDQEFARRIAMRQPPPGGDGAAMGMPLGADAGDTREGAMRAIQAMLPPGLRMRPEVNPQLLLLSLMGREFTDVRLSLAPARPSRRRACLSFLLRWYDLPSPVTFAV